MLCYVMVERPLSMLEVLVSIPGSYSFFLLLELNVLVEICIERKKKSINISQ